MSASSPSPKTSPSPSGASARPSSGRPLAGRPRGVQRACQRQTLLVHYIRNHPLADRDSKAFEKRCGQGESVRGAHTLNVSGRSRHHQRTVPRDALCDGHDFLLPSVIHSERERGVRKWFCAFQQVRMGSSCFRVNWAAHFDVPPIVPGQLFTQRSDSISPTVYACPRRGDGYCWLRNIRNRQAHRLI